MSLMCLFPWLDYSIDIVDFENFDFLVGQSSFTSVRAGQAGQNIFFVITKLASMTIKFSKIAET